MAEELRGVKSVSGGQIHNIQLTWLLAQLLLKGLLHIWLQAKAVQEEAGKTKSLAGQVILDYTVIPVTAQPQTTGSFRPGWLQSETLS